MIIFRVTVSRGETSRDLTPRVLSLRWRIGMADPDDSIAAPSSGQIVLNNRDRAASPELDPDDLLTPGAALLIENMDGGWHALFAGVVAAAAPDMGEHGQRRTVVSFEGVEAALARVPVRLPVMTDAGAGDVLAAVLDLPPLDALARSLDSGATRFSYVGDRWDSGVSAERAIRQVVDAERGRFYTARDGTLVFRGRHAGLADLTPAATFDAQADDARLTYGDRFANRVSVSLRPRSLGEPSTTLWTLSNAQRLRPNAGPKIVVPLRDGEGRRAGAVDLIAPVPYTDYTANTVPDGSGADATGDVTIEVLSVEGSAARLRLTNAGADAVYLMPGARLRGTPLVAGPPAVVEAEDADGIALHGLRPQALSLALLDSVEAAEQIAAWELAIRAAPAGAIVSLSLGRLTRYADALTLSLFDRLRVVDAQTGHDGLYDIVGEAHEIADGGARHRVVWTLAPASAVAYWTVGVSPLEAATRLAV
jgi:hypothetical protein